MERNKISEIISKWTKKSKSMLPKSPEEIQVFIDDGKAVIIEDGKGKPLGFGAQTFDWPDDWKELGAVVVDPKKRKQGIGSRVVTELVEKAKSVGGKPFALCNDKSIGLFLKNGGEIIDDPNLLPPEVWDECIKCPNFKKAKAQGKICCDTPVKIK